MSRLYSHIPAKHKRADSLPGLGRTHKTYDRCWREHLAKGSSSPARSLQLASSTLRDQADPMHPELEALGNVRIPTNTCRQEGSNRAQKQLKRGRATAYRDQAMRNGFSAVEWTFQTPSTLGLIIVPESQLNCEECTMDLANGLAAMEYAIQPAALRLAEESPTDADGQKASHELELRDRELRDRELRDRELRDRLFDFVRSHVVCSNSSSWDSARIQDLNKDFLQYLRRSSKFSHLQKFKRNTERQLALLFDAALQFRARLARSGEYRYELVQLKPDDLSEPGLLKVQGAEGIE